MDYKLTNKANVWQSDPADDPWEFEKNDDGSMFYIKTNQNKVLEAKDDSKVVFTVKDKDKAGQLWKKEDTMEGYFIFENPEFSKVLTANANALEIKGMYFTLYT